MKSALLLFWAAIVITLGACSGEQPTTPGSGIPADSLKGPEGWYYYTEAPSTSYYGVFGDAVVKRWKLGMDAPQLLVDGAYLEGRPVNGEMVLRVFESGQDRIQVHDLDGALIDRIVVIERDEALLQSPSFSSDGRFISYRDLGNTIAERGVWVVDRQSKVRVRISDDLDTWSWSRQGAYLAVRTKQKGLANPGADTIVLYNATTGERTSVLPVDRRQETISLGWTWNSFEVYYYDPAIKSLVFVDMESGAVTSLANPGINGGFLSKDDQWFYGSRHRSNTSIGGGDICRMSARAGDLAVLRSFPEMIHEGVVHVTDDGAWLIYSMYDYNHTDGDDYHPAKRVMDLKTGVTYPTLVAGGPTYYLEP